MNFAICDDCARDLQALRLLLEQYCQNIGNTSHIDDYPSGETLLAAENLTRYDVFFLDIYMDGLSGLQIGKTLRELAPQSSIIFITSSEERALESYGLQAEGYLVKPVGFSDLATLLNRRLSHLPKMGETLRIISNRLTLDIPISQILYIEVFNKKSLIHTAEGVFTTYTPLAKLSQELPSEHFMRCHKSFLVNMEAIISTGKDAFLLEDGTSIPISTRESKRLRELYNDWFWAKARRS